MRGEAVFSGTVAVAGIGATEFSKDSGRSELRLAVEAVTAALADAGLAAADVDGLVTFTMDGNAEIAVARELGLRELRFFSQIGYGGGAACATRAARGDGRRHRDGGRRGLLPGAQRALRPPLRPGGGRPGGQPDHGRDRQRLALPDGAGHARGDGRDGRPPVHALVRGDQRGLRPGHGRRPPARRDQPERLVLPAPGHAGRAPGSPAGSPSRCACSTAARKATAPSPSSSRASTGPATCGSGPR